MNFYSFLRKILYLSKWESGASLALFQGQSFWAVCQVSLIITSTPLLLIFFSYPFILSVKFLVRLVGKFIPIGHLLKFARREKATMRPKNNLVIIGKMQKSGKKMKHRMRLKIHEWIEKYGYWAFFFATIIPLVPYLAEIAAGICVSFYFKKGPWAMFKGFLATIGGNTFKIIYTTVIIHWFVHMAK